MWVAPEARLRRYSVATPIDLLQSGESFFGADVCIWEDWIAAKRNVNPVIVSFCHQAWFEARFDNAEFLPLP